MRRNILIVPFLVLLFSCNYKEEDVQGTWIAKDYPSHFPVYTFKSGNVSYYKANNEYVTHKFSIKDNAIFLKDVKSNFHFLLQDFKIESITNDTLLFRFEDEPLKIKFLRLKKLNFQKFDNIRIDYSNGWNASFVAEINRKGNLEIIEDNIWDKIKQKGNTKIKKERLDSIYGFSNYLFENEHLFSFDSNCSDCQSFILTFEKNKIRKRFFIKGNLESIFPYILIPIFNQIKECPKTKIDYNTKIERLYYPHKPKTVIEKIK